MNILLTWLGTADIENMNRDSTAAISTIASKYEQPFDKVVILANHHEDKWFTYTHWLKKRMAFINRPYNDIEIQQAHITTPIDFPTITNESRIWNDKLSAQADSLVINLTSGTPAITLFALLIVM